MEIVHYAENVYYQFYRKSEEVDYFLTLAMENNDAYSKAPSPKDNKFFDVMQFSFSAFLNAISSCWEISKLSIQLHCSLNSIDPNAMLPYENKLLDDQDAFEVYFSPGSENSHFWFRFMKAARNASAHDGTYSAFGGNTELFVFPSKIYRYDYDRRKNLFKMAESDVPGISVTASMLAIAYKLLPLFEKKLIKPELTGEDKIKKAKHDLSSIAHMMKGVPAEIMEWVLLQMIEAEGSNKTLGLGDKIGRWEKAFNDRFVRASS